MSVYHGGNQRNGSESFSGRFTIYEPVAYESDLQLRISRSLEANDRIEVYANFSQEEVVIVSLLFNITQGDLDENHGFTQSVGLEPGMYDVVVGNTYYVVDALQGSTYMSILLHQPVDSSFLPEVVAWSSYQFILGFCLLFLFLGGLCIGREDKKRRSEEEIDQEPPREGEVYGRRLGW
jgi:hypothetical protein